MVTEAEPEKARALSVAVSMVLFTNGVALHSAMCAALIVTGPLPTRLENCTRIWLPPNETCVTCRTTLFESEMGGVLLAFVSWYGDAVQVPTQFPVLAPAAPPVACAPPVADEPPELPPPALGAPPVLDFPPAFAAPPVALPPTFAPPPVPVFPPVLVVPPAVAPPVARPPLPLLPPVLD